MRILAVSRAEQFSPNSVERDWAIFQAVIDRLRRQGDDVSLVNEDNLDYSADGWHPSVSPASMHLRVSQTVLRVIWTLSWSE